MSSNITVKNNFHTFKEDFKKDTGLEFNKENMSIYLQYYSARMTDIGSQVLSGIANNLAVDFKQLPSNIRLELADMIKTHDTIKQLLKSKS